MSQITEKLRALDQAVAAGLHPGDRVAKALAELKAAVREAYPPVAGEPVVPTAVVISTAGVAKLCQYGDGSPCHLAFHCPGCGWDHAFTVGPQKAGWPTARWGFNGSLDKPTFTPSLLCNASEPASRCHSFVRDGRIQFLTDCWHKLAGQTVDLPDWE